MELPVEALAAIIFAFAAYCTFRSGLVAVPLTLLTLSLAASANVVLRATHLDHFFFAAFGA